MVTKDLLLFYNVENFFPPDEDSSFYKKSGLHNWNLYKYQLKLKKINNVLKFVSEDFKQLPSVIGLAEIGDQIVLEDLINQNPELSNFNFIYQKSNDSRGLSNALLYDNTKLTLLKTDFLTFYNEADKPFETRDILKATFIFHNKELNIFVVHLPSKRQQDVKKKMREKIIKSLRQITYELINKEKAFLIMGDFNENPTNQNLINFLKDETENQILENPFINFFNKNQFTTFHGKQGVVYDQMIYSKQLFENKIKFKTISATIYDNPKLKLKNSKHPNRTYSGSRYIGGYSDHFPILLELEK